MDKKIEDMDVTELKSAAYDTLAQIELHQRNLQVLNAEIGKRATEVAKTEE